jgi:hypothetical protein
MQRNKIILKVGLSMLILSLLLSIGLVSYMRLDEPVFLYNFKESNILSQEGYYSKRNFDFTYITNLGDSRYVTAISFPGAEAVEFSVIDPSSYLSSGAQDRYGQYALRTVNVTVTDRDVTTSFDPIELRNGIVTLSNGETMEVDFGRVVLTNHGQNYPSVQFISSTSFGSSDQANRNTSTFKASEALTLISIESPLFNDLDSMLSLEINGVDLKDIEGMLFDKDDIITVTTAIAPTEQLNSTYTAYEVQPLLTWQDENGDSHTQILNNINYRPYRFQLSGIVKYLKERGVL